MNDEIFLIDETLRGTWIDPFEILKEETKEQELSLNE